MRWPRGPRGAWRLLPRRSLLAALFLFSLSSSFLYFVYVAPGIGSRLLATGLGLAQAACPGVRTCLAPAHSLVVVDVVGDLLCRLYYFLRAKCGGKGQCLGWEEEDGLLQAGAMLVNTYLFMMQAQGIMIRENMRTIGAQVYEQVVRSAYAKRNSSVNDSGIS
ncbi:beta- -galactosyltransferase 5 [Limosa lapponica baueri]|uniref:Beta--galactosyltransferase 5 n=1 Tax=Limosa lapponica baueri TaxID=1758121 RepID=A0A2I0TVZ7_LIMLA|nr:beta- -galactosyltransferase 5 [Limosa lapponica baueri]